MIQPLKRLIAKYRHRKEISVLREERDSWFVYHEQCKRRAAFAAIKGYHETRDYYLHHAEQAQTLIWRLEQRIDDMLNSIV